ncbi:MAG: (2Fe-2S)-binding protein [Spirochaetia bacterium]
MRAEFLLNGERQHINISPELRLSELLRDEYGLLGTKSGCLMGVCGSCLVFLDSILTPACLTPAFTVDKTEIVTVEGIMEREDFSDIENGFFKAGMNPCGYCAAGKVMVTQAFLEKSMDGADASLDEYIDSVKCRCTSRINFKLGIQHSLEYRKRRENARQER